MSSTQDLARDRFEGDPLVVIAFEQTRGRGRSGAGWETAPAAVAATVAVAPAWPSDRLGLLPLLAGLAAAETLGVGLKWPNDLMSGSEKVGGILVEGSGDTALIGMGLNLWWPDAPEGMGALLDQSPEPEVRVDMVRRWVSRLLELVDAGPERWPVDRYRLRCHTIGRHITWEPHGSGRAVGVTDDGALEVETEHGTVYLHAGAVRHVR